MTASSNTSAALKPKSRSLGELERDLKLAKVELERRACEADLLTFCRAAWSVLEPQQPFETNWHHELIAEHLTLAAQRKIRRLIINMPPQHTKSRIATVLWPAWLWTKVPSSSWIFSGYSADLSVKKHSIERRDVLRSEWYQQRWGDQVRFSADQDRQGEYQNEQRGTMTATATGGTITGKGADFIVVDDPLNPENAHSDAERTTSNRYFDQTLYTRQRDMRASVIVIVMHRLHDADLCGHVQEAEPGIWTVLDLQAEAEQDTRHVFPVSGRVVERKEGDLLWPARFPQDALASAKRILGSWAYSAQYQQRATPKTGGLFHRDWWHFYGGPCQRQGCNGIIHGLPKPDEILQSWDCTFKETSDADHVAGHVYQASGADVYLLDRVNERMDFNATLSAVRTLSGKWPTAGSKLIEDKANGPAVINTLQHEIGGIIAIEPEGGKFSRAAAASPFVEAGNVYLPHPFLAPWVHDFIEQLAKFPKAAHDDDVDAFSQAMNRILAGPGEAMFRFMRQQAVTQKPPPQEAASRTIIRREG